MHRLTRLVFLAGLVACGGDPTLTEGPDPKNEREMFRAVLARLTTAESLPVAGDWPEDYGDANYFGAGFFLRYGQAGENPRQLDLAHQCRGHNEQLIDGATRDISTLMSRLEEVMMAGFGLIEVSPTQTAEPRSAARVEEILEVLTTLSRALSYYPENTAEAGTYGLTTYGASAINGGLALLNLEWAQQLEGTARAERIALAQEILDAGRARGYDEGKGYFRFSTTQEGLFLYPNVLQMLALVRLHQLSGAALPLDQARDLHRAIQPLKVAGEGRYRSPYSARTMGAATDDYTTLSSQNYTLIALAHLYQSTRDPAYREEILQILSFLRTHLLQEGRVLHHWMDGRIALPTDKEYYCSGCNLQLLYLVWRLEEWLAD